MYPRPHEKKISKRQFAKYNNLYTYLTSLVIRVIKNKTAIEAIFLHQTEQIKTTFMLDQAWRKPINSYSTHTNVN